MKGDANFASPKIELVLLLLVVAGLEHVTTCNLPPLQGTITPSII